MIEFFLVPVFAISLIASIEDFKKGIIRNHFILALLALGMLFQFFSGTSLPALATVLSGALAISFLFWLAGLWPAGDAKLFWAYFFFFPPVLLGAQSLLMDFLTNIFVPIFCFMFFVILYRSRLGLIGEALKRSLEPYKLFMLAIMLIGFVWVVSLPLAFFKLDFGFFGSLVILFAAYELLFRICTFRMELFFLLCAAARIVLAPREFYTISFALMLFKIIAVFVFFRFFILYLAFKLYTDKVKISELREGMAPAEGIFKKGDSFEKEEFLQSCFTGYFSQKTRKFIHGQESLSEEDVEKIKALEKQGKFKFDSLLVHQAQPFALFIFAGFLLTLLCAGSVVTFLRLAI